jgi:hypothetical protein
MIVYREHLKKMGLLVGLEDRPTLRLTAKDHVTARKHIHEGAWTLGLDEEDLPGFDHVKHT